MYWKVLYRDKKFHTNVWQKGFTSREAAVEWCERIGVKIIRVAQTPYPV